MDRRAPDPAVARAIDRVLAAEHDAEVVVAAAEREAEARLAAARERRHQILEAARRRSTRLHAAAQTHLARLIEALEAEGTAAPRDAADLDERARQAAVRVAARLTGDGRDPA
jgi:vacuolar-type H+-ATPase subunit H